jgi:carbon dioxide concentrating mechanism protein CcmO
MESALGLVSTQSFPAIVGVADAMIKAAGVKLVGYEKIGDANCTAVVRGNTADVRIAVAAGVEAAEQVFGQEALSLVIPRPSSNLEVILPIGSRLPLVLKKGYEHLSNQAIGLLETRGFPSLVAATDTMLKSAEVFLIGYERIGSGLCTAIIQGRVSDVVYAIEAGMLEAERVGELNAVFVIPRPLDDLEQTLPIAACLLEERQALLLPTKVKEIEKELVALPEQQIVREPLVLPNRE